MSGKVICCKVLDGLKHTSSHEWVKHEGSVAIIGITDHAQDHLEEVVFVDLPDIGGSVTKATGFGAVDSVKATSDVNSPISGQPPAIVFLVPFKVHG